MRGVWTALISPFNGTNELDLPAFKKILCDQREAGVAGVIPCGTTGESPTLTLNEKKTLISTAIQELKGSRLSVIAGTGSNNTAETVELSRWASKQGAQGVLVVTPYYNKPTQAGLETHFLAVADAVQCDVVLYNVPGRTGISLAANTIARLAQHPRIRAIKEATGNPTFSSDIIEMLQIQKQKMSLLSGDDATYLPLLSIGAVGIVSVASNLFPRAMVALQTAFENGQIQEARKIHQHYYPLFRDLFVESNPVPIKNAMAYAGWCEDRVRPPLAPLSSSNQKKLHSSLAQCGIVRGRLA